MGKLITWQRIKQGLQTVLPNYCVFCQTKTHSAQVLCRHCITQTLPWHRSTCCQICTLPLISGGTCGECLQNPPSFSRIIAPLLYQAPMNHLMSQIKFSKQLKYIPVLATILAQHLQQHHEMTGIDAIIPIPLHHKRLKQRGFNQSGELGKILEKHVRIPLDQRLLQRHKATEAQTHLNAKARAANLRNAFSIKKTRHYQRVALLDDVVTTGNTVRAASKVLKQHGVQQIEIWCIARATKC